MKRMRTRNDVTAQLASQVTAQLTSQVTAQLTSQVRAHTAALIFSLLAVAACGPDGAPGDDNSDLPPAVAGHAFLSIVGDTNVFVEGGAQQTITVKYHDENGQPLAGSVAFELVGNAAGGNLSTSTGVTNGQGLVNVEVIAGQEAAFQIKATAVYAEPVTWSIAVAAGEQPAAPLSLVGDYELESHFDLASGIPGTVGTVVNGLIDMTDGPTDPATWLIDQALDQITSSTIKSAVNAFRPGLDGFVNDALLAAAPDFVSAILDVGNDLGQVARQFGTVSVLKIVQGPGPDLVLSATHTLEGFIFTIDGQSLEYAMSELELGQSRAEGVAVTKVSETKVEIGDHTLPVSYGRVLLFALNHVIIPAVDPFASDLEDLLTGLVDCAAIGAVISDYVGIGSPGTYTAACQAGVGAVAQLIESQILAIDGSAAALVIHGDARPQDTTGDRRADKLTTGLWEGTMTFGPSTGSVLARPAQKFTGVRVGGATP